MRLLADMGISPATVAFLHEFGYDAMHLQAQGLDRMSDLHILAKARTENRIVLATISALATSWLRAVPGFQVWSFSAYATCSPRM